MAGRGMFAKLGLTMPEGSRKASNRLLSACAKSYNRVIGDDGTEEAGKMASRATARAMGHGGTGQRDRMLGAKARNVHEMARAEKAPPKINDAVLGVHHSGITARGEVPQHAISNAMRDVRANPKVLAALEAAPIGELRFLGHGHEEHGNHGENKSLGLYWNGTGRISVNHDLVGHREGGHELHASVVRELGTAQRPWTVPGKSFSKQDNAEAVVTHEVGHHIHGLGASTSKNYRAKIDAVVEDGYRRGNPVSEYAKTNKHEYFAESFSAYVYHHAVLKERDPVGHAMVERALALRAGLRAAKTTEDLQPGGARIGFIRKAREQVAEARQLRKARDEARATLDAAAKAAGVNAWHESVRDLNNKRYESEYKFDSAMRNVRESRMQALKASNPVEYHTRIARSHEADVAKWTKSASHLAETVERHKKTAADARVEAERAEKAAAKLKTDRGGKRSALLAKAAKWREEEKDYAEFARSNDESRRSYSDMIKGASAEAEAARNRARFAR